jgi:hypothetical protein
VRHIGPPLLLALLAACAAKSADIGTPQDSCLNETERERLLALDQNAFDQDLSAGGGGWRAIAAKDGCEIAAANLIREYRERHSSEETILFWHEGQMRAFGNDYATAVTLFERSRKLKDQDPAGWNHYVDASIAFLKRDKEALVKARSDLSAVKAPPELQLKDGALEVPNNSGTSVKIRWPPNLDVVDGLLKCFDKRYREAYGNERCRPVSPR